MRLFLFGSLLTLATLATGCDPAEADGPEPALTEAPADPTYGEHVSAILDTHCAGCHTDPPTGGAPAAVRLDTFDGASANIDRVVSRSVDGDPGAMPPGGLVLSAAEAETLVRWQETGTPE